jgi:ubiquinone/menaquinone biosynthesis C-methylase UbiE
VRRFSPAYLRDTRRGLWEDRRALAGLDLESRTRILDVGAGNGELTRVLQEESNARVVALDADGDLLRDVDSGDRVLGDATNLPFADGSFDLVVCQALLINLPDPAAAIGEFVRVSTDLVAAIEPDNSRVSIESTVSSEPALSRRARQYYMNGLETDVSLGSDVAGLFADAGLEQVRVWRHGHERVVEPPYSKAAVTSAKRKVTGRRLSQHRPTMLRGELTVREFDELRDEWQSMGREIVEQMDAETYRRRAVVPFFVTVGSIA